MTSPDSPAVDVVSMPSAAGAPTCQSCGHDADLHSASWGCFAVDADGVNCACMVPRPRIIGDAR